VTDPELFAKALHHGARAVDRAREITARLEHVTPDGLAMEERVERRRRFHDGKRHVDPRRTLRERFGRDPAFDVLECVKDRK
jgi:hypothetical protein